MRTRPCGVPGESKSYRLALFPEPISSFSSNLSSFALVCPYCTKDEIMSDNSRAVSEFCRRYSAYSPEVGRFGSCFKWLIAAVVLEASSFSSGIIRSIACRCHCDAESLDASSFSVILARSFTSSFMVSNMDAWLCQLTSERVSASISSASLLKTAALSRAWERSCVTCGFSWLFCAPESRAADSAGKISNSIDISNDVAKPCVLVREAFIQTSYRKI